VTLYKGTNFFEEVICSINGGKVFPPSQSVTVSCIVQSSLFCSQNIKNNVVFRINRAAQGSFDAWVGLPLIGDDPNSDELICNAGSCCNPRIKFEKSNILFRDQTGPGTDAWEFLSAGTHYMDILVNDTTGTIATYTGEKLFTLDSTAQSTFPELMTVEIAEDDITSSSNFTCNLVYTNPGKQLEHILVEITKIVNEEDLDSSQNVKITSSIPQWYLDDQPLKSTYKYSIVYEPSSCDSDTLTCTFQGVSEQFTTSTFSIKDGQSIICRASLKQKDSSVYEQTKEDSENFVFTAPGLAENAVSFGQGILDNPYMFLLIIIVVVVGMPIIIMLLRFLLTGMA
jgi:hypothetical protein